MSAEQQKPQEPQAPQQGGASAAHSEEEQRRTREWMERVEGRKGRVGWNYMRMWPIAAAPLIPLWGLLFKNNKKVRIALQAATGGGVVLYGFGWALSGSSDVTGG